MASPPRMRTRFVSPLRYPGGKGDLAPYIAGLIERQHPRPTGYIEPFAGGAGAALRLLRGEHVDWVLINDLDAGVAAFWRAVLERTDEFIRLVRSCRLTIAEWRRQHAVYAAGKGDDLQLGFATFYLNRTNRSGILDARPIGGLKQDGPWKLEARFNRDDLIERIRTLAQYRGRIEVSEQDGCELLSRIDSSGSFVYVDPPYLGPGADLYLDTMRWEDHVALAGLLRERHQYWMVTYDADARVSKDLYPKQRTGWFTIGHTAADQHMGKEYVVYADAVDVQSLRGLSKSRSAWHRGRSGRS